MLSITEKEKIADLIEITAEISGNPFKPQVIALMVEDLAEWDFNEIQAALNACRREVKGRLSLKDIIDRLPKKGDVLPSADEAWGQIVDFGNEYKTIIAPKIAFQAAYQGAFALMDTDKVGARMAFKAAYERLVPEYLNKPIEYQISLSNDRNERREALIRAVEDGKITKQHALKYDINLEFKDEPLLLPQPINEDEWRRALMEEAENGKITKQHALKLIEELKKVEKIVKAENE